MMEALCRLCLVGLDVDDCGYSIADDRFREALEQVFTFKLAVGVDDLPMYTCKQCSWNVLDFQSFSELVQTNQAKLLEGSLLDEHEQAIAGQENAEISAEFAYDEDGSERSVTNEFEPSNTESEDMECSSPNVEEVVKLHSDHVYSSKADQNANDQLDPVVIYEEYLITADEVDASEPRNGADEVLDSNEPPTKKPKIPNHDATGNENNNLEPCRSDTNDGVSFASKTYPCERCDERFESKWLADYHMQEHTVAKCMFCKKSVPLKRINNHMTTHLADFNCNLCKKKFLSQRDLKYHKKICKERT